MTVPEARVWIQRAALSDVAELTVLERKAFSGYYASHRFSKRQFEYYLKRSGTVAYVARVLRDE